MWSPKNMKRKIAGPLAMFIGCVKNSNQKKHLRSFVDLPPLGILCCRCWTTNGALLCHAMSFVQIVAAYCNSITCNTTLTYG